MTDPAYDLLRSGMEAIPEKLAESGGALPSGLSCPDCSGVLEVKQLAPGALNFRCRIGHVYDGAEVLRGKEEELERRLWSALAATEELEALIGALVRWSPGNLNAEATTVRQESLCVLRTHLQTVTAENHSMATESGDGLDT